ncbi:MAG: radical SAM protein [Bacillota bacterium]|jgi:putative pyruvate formate lyase activating enzyme
MGSVDSTVPSYVGLYRTGELARRAEEAVRRLSRCVICAQACNVNRIEGELGFCRTGRLAVVSSAGRHFGEEDVLVGTGGSGTIFFANCNLACVFCQNYDISACGFGKEVSRRRLADMMLSLQAKGCHNINLVSPSHVVPQVLEALVLAVEEGLRLPLVYNTGGYDALSTLKLLDGIVDIYMPDFKFADADDAERFSAAPRYPTVAQAAIREMHRQVGDLVVDEDGVARRGLILRHLVMPGKLDDTREIMRFVVRYISRDTYVNVMGQYRPAHLASRYPELSRALGISEHQRAIEIAREEGLYRFAR